MGSATTNTHTHTFNRMPSNGISDDGALELACALKENVSLIQMGLSL